MDRRKLTYIVCGKRHHLSIFPKDSKDADPKNGNVKAGVRTPPRPMDLRLTISFADHY